MEVLLFVDTETTGLPTDTSLSPSETDDWPRLVEIAWRTYSKSGQELNATSTLIRPDGFEIPEAATEVHGITTEEAREHGSPLEGALTEFEEEVREADCLVAHNIAFDRGVLLAEYHRTGVDSSLAQLPTLCTMVKGREVVSGSGKGKREQPLDQKVGNDNRQSVISADIIIIDSKAESQGKDAEDTKVSVRHEIKGHPLCSERRFHRQEKKDNDHAPDGLNK